MGIPVVVQPFLSVRLLKPIKFTGTGEKITDIEYPAPNRMSGPDPRYQGDMLTLIEKASRDTMKASASSLKDAGKYL